MANLKYKEGDVYASANADKTIEILERGPGGRIKVQYTKYVNSRSMRMWIREHDARLVK